MEGGRRMNKKQLGLIMVIIVSVLMYFFVPSVTTTINQAISAMKDVDLQNTIEYIRGYGSYAAIVSFLLMLLQSIISPIPAFLITLSNAAIFGWYWGAALSWTSSMVGALICYYIARILGRDVVMKFTSQNALDSLDKFFNKYGKYTIFVCRLLPFMSFDLVSYAAGLTSIKVLPFVIATGLGQLPATLVYSYLGQNITEGGQKLFFALLILFAGTTIIYVAKKVYNERHDTSI